MPLNQKWKAWHTLDFFVEVARGALPGVSSVQKFGRNSDIDTLAEEDIWAGGGTRAYLTSAETMDIVSTSINDDGSPVGTGARTLTIEGLDANYQEVSDTITLNGTTASATTQSFLRVHRAYVETAGSVETNDGDITVDPTTSGSGSRQALIAAGDGQTLIGHYTVPANKTAYMVGAQISAGGATSAKAVVRLLIRTEGGAWRVQSDINVQGDGTSVTPDVVFSVPVKFNEKTDIKWRASVNNNNTSVYVQYNLLLIDHDYNE